MKQALAKFISSGPGAGFLATLPMSAVLLAAQAAGFLGEQPPKRVTRSMLERFGAETPSEEKTNAATTVMHFGYGTAAGGTFKWLYRRLRLPASSAVQGMGFGLAVWAFGYKGWIPAFGILPPPEEGSNLRVVSLIAAHLAYGAALGVLAGRA